MFNHRTDEYDNCAENRARFAVEAVRAVHRQSSEISIAYKLTVRQVVRFMAAPTWLNRSRESLCLYLLKPVSPVFM